MHDAPHGDVARLDWFGASAAAPLPGRRGRTFWAAGAALVAVLRDADFAEAGCVRRGAADVLTPDRALKLLAVPPADRAPVDVRALAEAFQDYYPMSLLARGPASAELFEAAIMRTFPQSETIALEGDAPQGLWIVLQERPPPFPSPVLIGHVSSLPPY